MRIKDVLSGIDRFVPEQREEFSRFEAQSGPDRNPQSHIRLEKIELIVGAVGSVYCTVLLIVIVQNPVGVREVRIAAVVRLDLEAGVPVPLGKVTPLIAAAEAEAASRGRSQTVHFTYDFQARALYERNGYELVGRVRNFPSGTDVLWYRKSLERPVDMR